MKELLTEYELLKKNIEKDGSAALPGLRPGTVSLLRTCTAKEPEGMLKYLPRVVSFVFGLMALNNAVSQLKAAYQWLPVYPFISLFLLAKELIGFMLIVRPGIHALIERPSPQIYGKILDPLWSLPVPSKAKDVLSAVLYAVSSLSNLRETISLAIACRWGVDVPLFLHEFDVQKVGNLIFTALNLAIRPKKEGKLIAGMFLGIITNLPGIIIGVVNHYKTDWQLAQFLEDIQDGRIGREELALAMETLYRGSTGEKCKSAFIANILSGRKNVAVKEEVEKKSDKNRVKAE
jgi:hypothetical protein